MFNVYLFLLYLSRFFSKPIQWTCQSTVQTLTSLVNTSWTTCPSTWRALSRHPWQYLESLAILLPVWSFQQRRWGTVSTSCWSLWPSLTQGTCLDQSWRASGRASSLETGSTPDSFLISSSQVSCNCIVPSLFLLNGMILKKVFCAFISTFLLLESYWVL